MGCIRNVTGKTSPAAAAALPLMEEKKQKKIKAPGAPAKLAGYGMYPKRDGKNFAGGRSRPCLDGRKEAKEDQGARGASQLWPGTSLP